MNYPENVDDTFFAALLSQFNPSPDSGKKIGQRMLDDFFIRSCARKVESKIEFIGFAKKFFKIYFNFDASVNTDNVFELSKFCIKKRESLELIKDVLVELLGNLWSRKFSINIVDNGFKIEFE